MYNIEKIRKDEAIKDKEKRLSDQNCIAELFSFYLPNFSLKKKELPEMSSWKVGKECELTVKVRMTGYDERKSLNQEGTIASGQFDIVGIELKKKLDNDELNEE